LPRLFTDMCDPSIAGSPQLYGNGRNTDKITILPYYYYHRFKIAGEMADKKRDFHEGEGEQAMITPGSNRGERMEGLECAKKPLL